LLKLAKLLHHSHELWQARRNLGRTNYTPHNINQTNCISDAVRLVRRYGFFTRLACPVLVGMYGREFTVAR
jgi:hypothetical protein